MSTADAYLALAAECDAELDAILRWWSEKSVDPRGGFFGEIDANDRPVLGASKGAVLNARILWFFSAAAQVRPDALPLAERAYAYFRDHFIDRAHGGAVWELSADGALRDGKKQCYAQAFAIYGLSAFYAATKTAEALALANDMLARLQERYADPHRGGYIEALARDWSPLEEVRLSEVDANDPKTMNTHLHVLEAVSLLHAVAPTAATSAALRSSLALVLERFLNPETHHLRLFFSMDWQDRSHAISFGHDIEASWLIWEAAEALGDRALSEHARPQIVQMARAILNEAVAPDGALYNERSLDGRIDCAHIWWVQAEAMAGFVNAHALTGEEAFFAAAASAWRFIKSHIRDAARGEWMWWSHLDEARADRAYKAGFWKCPYHNGRAMMEVSRRLKRLAAAKR